MGAINYDKFCVMCDSLTWPGLFPLAMAKYVSTPFWCFLPGVSMDFLTPCCCCCWSKVEPCCIMVVCRLAEGFSWFRVSADAVMLLLLNICCCKKRWYSSQKCSLKLVGWYLSFLVWLFRPHENKTYQKSIKIFKTIILIFFYKQIDNIKNKMLKHVFKYVNEGFFWTF